MKVPAGGGSPSRIRHRGSLPSRLLLGSLPLAVVLAILIVIISAPLFRTPRLLDRMQRDLTEILQMQELARHLSEQPKHWSEYIYLPVEVRDEVRAEIAKVDGEIAGLERLWASESPATVRATFEAYEALSRAGAAVLAAVDAGDTEQGRRVLARDVLPTADGAVAELDLELADRIEALTADLSRLVGTLRVTPLGAGLAAELRAIKAHIRHAVTVTGLEDLVVRQASEYTQIIASGDPRHRRELVVLSSRLTDELTGLGLSLGRSGESEASARIEQVGRFHAEMSSIGDEVLATFDAGSPELAAELFERRLHRVLDDELLPAAQLSGRTDRREVSSGLADLSSSAERMRSLAGIAGLASFGLLVIPALLIGRSTVRPLRKIQRAALRVGEGDFSARSEVDEVSEVGELARAFDAMAQHLEESRGALLSAAVVEASSDLILIVKDNRVSYASGASARLLGRPPEDLCGQDISSLVHGDHVGTLTEWLEAEAPSATVELQFLGLEGPVDTEVALTDLQEDPQVAGMVLSVRDVAERRKIAVELAAARDAALEASRLKSEFLATMSHEIRTPMNGVIGLTGLLLRTELDQRQRQYAERVQGAGEALLAIINDILDFSKIEAGKLELEVVDFELVRLVEEAAGLVAEPARRKGLELVAYCDPTVPAGLSGDPSRLRQVLLNLASNAVKFTEAGEVVIRAHLVRDSEDVVVVRFEVSDTGVGITQEDQKRLFEPFVQADTSTTRQYGGTGLGLAISTQLVAAMGGELGVDSEPGLGSTFWFTLPLRRAVDGAVAEFRPFRHRLEGLGVLVVDDNETNRMILVDQLSAWDVRADQAHNGFEAMKLIREAERPYDVALLDMCMDGMDGLELARLIREDPDRESIRLVLLTSAIDVSPDDIALAGISAALTKPVRLSELYDTLMRVTAPVTTYGNVNPRSLLTKARSRGHVLVVEDNVTNQMVARGILESIGFEADVAANGLEALEALGRTQYAAVLMDCQMPEMDGYAATEQIRFREGDSGHTPIIAMTAGAVEGDRERCLAAGMDGYISKPVTPEAVDDALTRWVGESSLVPSDGAYVANSETFSAGIDLERIEVLRRIGPTEGSVLRNMVEAFASQASEDAASLKLAFAKGDVSDLQDGAHRLRGAAANLGATALAALCSDIESLASNGMLDETTELLHRLTDELDQAVAGLRGTLMTPVPRTRHAIHQRERG